MNSKNRIYYEILLLFILSFVQNKIIALFSINNWIPDVTLIYIFIIGQIYGRATACFYGFIAGVFQDFSVSYLGYAALAKSIFGFISGYFHFNEHYNTIKFINGLLLVTIIEQVIYHGLYFYGFQSFFDTFIIYVIPNAIYTVIFAAIIYYFLENRIVALYVSRKS
jgi:rod shape-determining protein MreD